jgi:hypothetical protein
VGIHKKTLTLNLPLTKLQCSPLEKNKKSRHPPTGSGFCFFRGRSPPAIFTFPLPASPLSTFPHREPAGHKTSPQLSSKAAAPFPSRNQRNKGSPDHLSLPTVPLAQHHFPSTLTGPNKPSSPLSLPQPLYNPTPNFFPQISHSSAVHRFTGHRQLQTGQNPNASSPMVTPLAA